MGWCIETLGYQATAPGSAGAAAAAFSGDSLVVKAVAGLAPARLAAWWGRQQVAGWQQLTWPTGHDTTRGVRSRAVAGDVSLLAPVGFRAAVQSQEAITARIAGSATAGQIELGFITVEYPDLPGVSPRYVGVDEVERRVEAWTSVEFTLSMGTAGGWSGAELITSESDLLLANREYALVGVRVGSPCGCIAVYGPDTGGLRVGVPGVVGWGDSAVDWFVRLSLRLRRAAVPVLNSANRANTYIVGAVDQAGGSVTGSLVLGLLGGG